MSSGDDADISDDSAFYCGMCDAKFPGLDEMREHIAEAHPDQPEQKKKEEKKPSKQTDAKIPARRERDSAFYCASCSFKTFSYSALMEHRKKEHGDA